MALDPSIALQYKAPTFDNPLAQLAQVSAIQNAQNQNQLAQYTLSKAQRSDADAVTKRNLLTGAGGDIDKAYNALAENGFMEDALALRKLKQEQDKNLSEIGKNNATAGKAQAETLNMKLQQHKDLLSQVTDPQAAAAWVMAGYGDPDVGGLMKRLGANPQDIIAKIPADPAGFQKWRAEAAMNGEKMVQYTMPDANTVANNDQSDKNNRRTVATTARGQDMVDGRSREANANGKVPAGYRANPDGSLSYIPGGPADPKTKGDGPPTEGERKAATLLKRLEGSKAQLDAALQDDPKAAKPGVIASGLRAMNAESAANGMDSSARQRVEAAQLDMLDAALTLGTGAAYTNEQLKGYAKSYFPQINDTPAQIKDKEARLRNVIEAAKIAAGRAAIDLTKVKPGTQEEQIVQADARRIGELRNKPKSAPSAGGGNIIDFGDLK